MQLTISIRGTERTAAIEQYIEKKLGNLEKYFKPIVRAEIVAGLETHHHQKGGIFFAEGKLEVPGSDIFAKKTANGLYEAVDVLRDHLEQELKKHKIKLQGNVKKAKTVARLNKEYHEND